MTKRLTSLLGCTLLCLMVAGVVRAADKPEKTSDFEKEVLPLFTAKCNRCHGGQRRGGKLDMRTLDALLKGGVSGPAIKPGNAPKSLLIEMIHYDEMPPPKEQPRITADELNLLRRWVDGMKP